MILVDTSVWVDHLRSGNVALARLLDEGRVLAHPFVVGELALGSLKQRERVLDALLHLPAATLATDGEVRQLIDREGLSGTGIGYVDAHLLASARLSPGASLWTRDGRLLAVARKLAVSEELG